MNIVWSYSLLSVLAVSCLSLIGLASFGIKQDKLKKILIYFVSFSAGALFGDAFIHLLPESTQNGFTLPISFAILGGIVLFFIIEKVIHWHHCHTPESKEHKHPVTYISIVGDMLHNFIDGSIIAASYLISTSTGLATTVAVAFHEIPHELGNYSILLHGGFSRKKALLVNFLTALTAILGAAATLWLSVQIEGLKTLLIPIAAGTFIYIAGSDLVPELHKNNEKITQSLLQLLAFLIGIAFMALFLLFE